MHTRLLQYGPVYSNGNIQKPAPCWSQTSIVAEIVWYWTYHWTPWLCLSDSYHYTKQHQYHHHQCHQRHKPWQCTMQFGANLIVLFGTDRLSRCSKNKKSEPWLLCRWNVCLRCKNAIYFFTRCIARILHWGAAEAERRRRENRGAKGA